VAELAEHIVDARCLSLDIGLAVGERYERWRRFDAVTDGLNRRCRR
jgi:hypothetical protein